MSRLRWITAGAAALVAVAALTVSIVLRDEPVVPEGAVRAQMYVDWHAATSWPADAVIDKDVAGVITTLNALPSTSSDDGCALAMRPNYRMRFEYPDGSDRTVVFDMNCATVHSGDVVRYGKITKALDAFAESYRARGGTAPDPPWQW